MPVVFANEYNKYQNKLEYQIGRGLFNTFQDIIKPSISPVICIISNIKEVKDNVTDKYETKTSSDINTFYNFNKISKSKDGIPIFDNPDIPPKDLAIVG